MFGELYVTVLLGEDSASRSKSGECLINQVFLGQRGTTNLEFCNDAMKLRFLVVEVREIQQSKVELVIACLRQKNNFLVLKKCLQSCS